MWLKIGQTIKGDRFEMKCSRFDSQPHTSLVMVVTATPRTLLNSADCEVTRSILVNLISETKNSLQKQYFTLRLSMVICSRNDRTVQPTLRCLRLNAFHHDSPHWLESGQYLNTPWERGFDAGDWTRDWVGWLGTNWIDAGWQG